MHAMIVYSNIGFSKDLYLQKDYCWKLFNGLLFHFQNLDFGVGVSEIAQYAACGDASYLRFYGEGISYKKKSSTINCLFFFDYEITKSLDGEDLLRYFSKRMIEENNKFALKKIKNFDLHAYIKSLEEYFTQAILTLAEGKTPGEGKELNKEIEIEIAKKWSNL